MARPTRTAACRSCTLEMGDLAAAAERRPAYDAPCHVNPRAGCPIGALNAAWSEARERPPRGSVIGWPEAAWREGSSPPMSTSQPADSPRLAVLGLPEDDAAERACELAALGFDSLIAGLDQRLIDAARAAGLWVFVYTGTFSVTAEDPAELLAVDVNGVPRRWFNSGCPNRPELRARHLERVRGALSGPEVAGFYLDGIRFASPAPGLDAFLTCFCNACAGRAAELGFDFTRMRGHVRAFGDRVLRSVQGLERLGTPPGMAGVLAELPGVADWLAFRAACIADHVSGGDH